MKPIKSVCEQCNNVILAHAAETQIGNVTKRAETFRICLCRVDMKASVPEDCPYVAEHAVSQEKAAQVGPPMMKEMTFRYKIKM